MKTAIYKAIPCKISRGVFSTERLIEVNEIGYSGFAPQHWCWNKDGHLLRKSEAAGNEPVDGFVAARIVEKTDGGKVKVTIPSGDYIEVKADALVERPTKVGTNVPV